MSLIANYATLRTVEKYQDLPVAGNTGDQIIVASLGRVARWLAGAWDITVQVDSVGSAAAASVAANQADSVAADTAAMVVDFNLLLDKLKAAGLMVAD